MVATALCEVRLRSDPPLIRQVLMHECDRHASLAHGRGNTFDRAQPHVAASKNTGDTCFKKVGIAAVRPAAGFPQIVTRQNISARIARDVRRQPFCLRVSPNEDVSAAQ